LAGDFALEGAEDELRAGWWGEGVEGVEAWYSSQYERAEVGGGKKGVEGVEASRAVGWS
jgi:hypothetical protein